MLVVDDRRARDLHATNGHAWRLVTDGVMGGVSQGQLTVETTAGRSCIRLRGEVSLDHNGGFIQAALELADDQPLDASAYAGLVLDVYGNHEAYNVHLRTEDLSRPWQSYRARFDTKPEWQTVKLPFDRFIPHRTTIALDLRCVRRLGLVAIGRAFTVDVCLARLALYGTSR